MSTLTNFPIKHLDGNLAFGRDGTVWAYYEIPGFGYDLRDAEQQKVPFYNQLTFLVKNNYDLHMLLVPYQVDPTTVLDATIQSVKDLPPYDLKDAGIKYLEDAKGLLKRNTTGTANQYHSFVGVQLDPKRNKYKEGNTGTQAIENLKMFIDGIKSPVRQASGLDPYDILESEISAYKEQAEILAEAITAAYSSKARPLTRPELLYITEYGLSFENELTELQDVSVSETVTGKLNGETVHAVRPDKEVYYRIQSAEVVPFDKHTIKLRKAHNGKIREEFVRYMVVDKMNDLNHHPGFEWVYRLQKELTFPVGVSIRACNKPNKNIRKELSNALLEFDDQRKEANKAGMDMAKSVKTAEAGAVKMEEVFQKSGHPAYNCSFAFRIIAESEAELTMRCLELVRMLARHNVSVRSPYGDAIRYFMEFVPTNKREHDDYWQTVSPGVLAALMFGATTNVGDNRGFLIGFTKNLKKPVFIQLDLAAKDYEGIRNLTDSLAVMFAGDTGKGKSVAMNLIATISALTLGSKVLIIDPKGDRVGWADGLPHIPKEHISVWTLRADNPDDAGCVDPFRTAGDVNEAKDIWMDVISSMMGMTMKDPKYAMLSDAIEKAADHPDPCGQVIIDVLKEESLDTTGRLSETRKVELETLVGFLETMQRNRLAVLLFGKPGQKWRSLSSNKPIQVLMVQHLELPRKGEDDNMRPVKKISEGIMISLSAFTKQFVRNNKDNGHKIIMQDEAKTMEDSKIGSEQIDWLQRMGRHFNNTLLKATQNASDYDDANNIGMKFCFQLPQEPEAARILKFYNLPVTQTNLSTVMKLRKGECLFQDIYGRTAVISINTIFTDILEAFRTDTSTKEEREREAAKQKMGV